MTLSNFASSYYQGTFNCYSFLVAKKMTFLSAGIHSNVYCCFSSIASACCKSMFDPDFFCYIGNAGDGNALRTQSIGIGDSRSAERERESYPWLAAYRCDREQRSESRAC
jgi:hypothetical protein